MTPAAFLVAAAVGLGMGVLGGGGSIVAVPALAFFLHFSPKDAVATSLILVGLVAAAGAFGAWWRGVLPVRIALTVAAAGMTGSLAGSMVGARLPDRWQMLALALVMFGAALLMWRRGRAQQHDAHPAGLARLLLIGLAVGTLTGLLGVGGGFLIVPALVVAAGQPIRKAAAASLFVIAVSAATAFPVYASRTTVGWAFIAPFCITAGGAAIGGGVIAHRLPPLVLQRTFAATLVILGTYVLLQA